MTKDKHLDKAIPKGCPLDRVFRLLSGEWTTHILWVLSQNGPTRHGELRRLVEGISSKVLTDRLRMLEANDVVFRDYEPTVPPKVTYGLTAVGKELDQALRAMQAIAEHWT
ncbi:helix-turn-helix transcriptional regulator [Exilibacterium tricleocarpae]|uniref:Helix-turn-helix transcriptional regulator n=1 Tax=Exilibacterium tricleocarpae TaxID=2591008 RepID=A0A545TLD0_9GAMM|nr:helix-turn-helix domain-containing protein [Exilibacterium tricleocarpae]TQV78034.1 helix-turn-helix transcriptional regulator [Exilibacterium tricleocarpae]